jgi:PAS domain S-box-containing protein
MKLKEAQKLIEQSHDRFLKVFFSSPAAMGICTVKEGRFINVNHRCVEFFGYTREEMIGRTSDELKLWVDNNHRTKAIHELLKSGDVGNWQGKFRLKSGKIKDIIFSMERIHFMGKESVLLFMYEDVSTLKKAGASLRESLGILAKQKTIMEKNNVVLGEVIAHIEVEKDKIKEDIMANIELLMPLFGKIKIKGDSQHFLDLIKKGLENVVSSFGRSITEGSLKLTSREVEICNMIKGGIVTKDIARALYITSQTIEKHRKNIRKKMGISNTSVNLTTFLRSI